MIVLSILTLTVLAVSLALNPAKTWEGIVRGMEMFFNILPTLISVLMLVSFFLFSSPTA